MKMKLFSSGPFKSILAASIVTIIIFSSCKKSDNNSNNGGSPQTTGDASASFTIDGDGYKNQDITINVTKNIPENAATYNIRWAFTGVRIDDRKKEAEEDKNSLVIYFKNKQTGKQLTGAEFPAQDGPQTYVNFQLDLTAPGVDRTTYGFDPGTDGAANTPGSITIKNYGNVNGSIEGEFEGKLMNATTGEFVHITNGHFKVGRISDTD